MVCESVTELPEASVHLDVNVPVVVGGICAAVCCTLPDVLTSFIEYKSPAVVSLDDGLLHDGESDME